MKDLAKVIIWFAFVSNFIGILFWDYFEKRIFININRKDPLIEFNISHSHDLIIIMSLVSLIGLVIIYITESNSKKLDELKELIEKK